MKICTPNDIPPYLVGRSNRIIYPSIPPIYLIVAGANVTTPEHDFYTVAEVSEKLECSIDDIVRWGAEEKIEIRVFFDGHLETGKFEACKANILMPGPDKANILIPDPDKAYRTEGIFSVRANDLLRLNAEIKKAGDVERRIEIREFKAAKDKYISIIGKPIWVPGEPEPFHTSSYEDPDPFYISYRNLIVMNEDLIRLVESRSSANNETSGNMLTEGNPSDFWEDKELKENAFQIIAKDEEKVKEIFSAMKDTGFELKSPELLMKTATEKFDTMPLGSFKFVTKEILEKLDFSFNRYKRPRDFESRIFQEIVAAELGVRVSAQKLLQEFREWKKARIK